WPCWRGRGRNGNLLGRSKRGPDVSRLRYPRDGEEGQFRGSRLPPAARRAAQWWSAREFHESTRLGACAAGRNHQNDTADAQEYASDGYAAQRCLDARAL